MDIRIYPIDRFHAFLGVTTKGRMWMFDNVDPGQPALTKLGAWVIPVTISPNLARAAYEQGLVIQLPSGRVKRRCST